MKTIYLVSKIGAVMLMISGLSACFNDDNDKPKVNLAPVAESLTIMTQTETAIMGNLSASDPENDMLSYTVASEPALGSIDLSTDGTFTYQPFNEQVGTDVFTFNVTDIAGNAAMGTVSVEIEILPVQFTQFTRDVFSRELNDDPVTVNGKAFIQDSNDQIDYQDLLDNN